MKALCDGQVIKTGQWPQWAADSNDFTQLKFLVVNGSRAACCTGFLPGGGTFLLYSSLGLEGGGGVRVCVCVCGCVCV